MRHLRPRISIKWQDKLSNNEILERSNMTGVKAMIMAAQLRWSGHIIRMKDCRLPKKILYGELREGKRPLGDQKKHFKITWSRISKSMT